MDFKKLFSALLLFSFLTTAALARKAPVVTPKELTPAVGCWLADLQYGSTMISKPRSANASVVVKRVGKYARFAFTYTFENEGGNTSQDTLTVSKNGRKINGALIISKQVLRNGSLEIVTEADGFDADNNAAVTYRYTYVFGKKSYHYKKEVKQKNIDEWMMREEFKLTRKSC